MTKPSGTRIITVDFKNQPIYEIGAVYLTTMLFSAPDDTDDDRGRVHTSLCKWALNIRAMNDPDWSATPCLIKPNYASWADATVNRDIKLINRRMHDRMIAARIVLPFLEKAQSGEMPESVREAGRLTVNRMAERALPESMIANIGNLKTRVWRPSKSVLHLAAATEVVRQLWQRRMGHALAYDQLLWSPLIIRWILAEAQKYEPLFEKSNRNKELRMDPNLLVRMRFDDKK